jgi:O-antigen/teichoic acid export membrane protein
MAAEISLRRSALALALASGLEYGLQLALPIILVRCLDPHAFGQYRFLWLLTSTVLAIAPSFMPQTLFYFLPRADAVQKPALIGNVLVYLIVAACTAVLVIGGWNPLLPKLAHDLFFQTYGVSALFVALWVVASMLDVLPTADGRAPWQAKATAGLALLRAALLASAAYLTNNIEWILIAMVGLAVAKIVLLFRYVRSRYRDDRLSWQMELLKRQFLYAVPFAVGNALFLLRIQADEWVVATMLSPELYATFTIASVVLPVATLIRQPVYNAMMPHLNAAYASGNFPEVARLIGRSNGATALLLLPIAGGVFTVASQVVEIVYTRRYLPTVPVMQIYLLGMMMNAFAIGHVLPALNIGRFVVINSACCLVISIVLSVVGVRYWGMIGAACGSVVTFALSELLSLRMVARKLGIGTGALLKWDALGPILLATFAAMAGTLWLAGTAASSFGTSPVVLLIEKGIVYAILFFPCFLLAGGRKHLGLLMRRFQAG